MRSDRTSVASRLAREWQYYVAASHSLTKVFLSIKGIYFQAVVHGVPVTWLQPWQYAQVGLHAAASALRALPALMHSAPAKAAAA